VAFKAEVSDPIRPNPTIQKGGFWHEFTHLVLVSRALTRRRHDETRRVKAEKGENEDEHDDEDDWAAN